MKKEDISHLLNEDGRRIDEIIDGLMVYREEHGDDAIIKVYVSGIAERKLVAGATLVFKDKDDKIRELIEVVNSNAGGLWTPWYIGRLDFLNDRAATQCPFPVGTTACSDWNEGWRQENRNGGGLKNDRVSDRG